MDFITDKYVLAHTIKITADFKLTQYKKAFTLAEVLVTLSIIGIIAAMTIPTMISNYQKHTYVVGLKKANSELLNAIKMMPLTENCPAGDLDCAGWYNNKPIDGMTFNETGYAVQKSLYLLSKQFKGVKFVQDSKFEFIAKSFSDRVNGTQRRDRQDGLENVGFVTQDGMTFTSSGASGLEVDVNGKKGPNNYGRDIFLFDINAEGISPKGIEYKETIKQECKTYGYSCTWRVLSEDKMDY